MVFSLMGRTLGAAVLLTIASWAPIRIWLVGVGLGKFWESAMILASLALVCAFGWAWQRAARKALPPHDRWGRATVAATATAAMLVWWGASLWVLNSIGSRVFLSSMKTDDVFLNFIGFPLRLG